MASNSRKNNTYTALKSNDVVSSPNKGISVGCMLPALVVVVLVLYMLANVH